MEEFLRQPLSLFDIRGRRAVISGATGAFGALASKVLAGAGAKVLLAGANTKALAQLRADCAQLGAEVLTIEARPDSPEQAERILATAVGHFGGVDILVTAAGINDVSPIVDMTPERFERVMDVNVTGSWLLARAAGAHLIRQGQGGKVVLMSSARGLLGHPAGYSAYCASKSAIDGITRALGCEWGKYGITVNAIAPTVFRSPLTAWMYEDNEKARTARTGFSRVCRSGGWASRQISPGLYCSYALAPRTSTRGTRCTPTAATPPAEP